MRGQTNASNVGGTVGDDTHPIKIVNNIPTPVANHVLCEVDNSLVLAKVQQFFSGDDSVYRMYNESKGVGIYASFELRINSQNGTVTLFLQKRRSDGTYLAGTTIATL